ncbi:RNA polymerase primary sigma factor [Lachnospiraceae bacterium PM6-15]|uniref:sigma-70 family RNA polymerase sigma factor n=1 Tax=Ohessyouella blattaphilus TaxID=2949333 RepID=UPI003E244AAB
MSNEELVRDIQAGASDKMLLLWKQCEKFIVMIANKYVGHTELEDLVQEGYFALHKAVQGYDETKEVTFIHYLAFWLKQVYIRHNMNYGQTIRIPAHAQSLIYRYKNRVAAFTKEHGRKPSDCEIVALMDISQKQLEHIRENMRNIQLRSLDETLAGDDESSFLGELIPVDSYEDDTILKHDRQQLKEDVEEVLKTLDTQQQRVIKARYFDGMTLAEAGEQIGGVTRERVRQVQQKALNTLRLKKHSDKLRPYYDEYLAAHAYRHIGVAAFQRNGISSTEYAAFRLMD